MRSCLKDSVLLLHHWMPLEQPFPISVMLSFFWWKLQRNKNLHDVQWATPNRKRLCGQTWRGQCIKKRRQETGPGDSQRLGKLTGTKIAGRVQRWREARCEWENGWAVSPLGVSRTDKHEQISTGVGCQVWPRSIQSWDQCSSHLLWSTHLVITLKWSYPLRKEANVPSPRSQYIIGLCEGSCQLSIWKYLESSKR